MSTANGIGVVIVTYNRINELKKTLMAYETQEYAPQYILVVNNNSSDGTLEYLKSWEQDRAACNRYVINLAKNIGGSGGFATGMEAALKLKENAEWIWVADDDALVHNDTLKNLDKIITELRLSMNEKAKLSKTSKTSGSSSHTGSSKRIAAVCAAVMNNGRIDTAHRRMIYTDGIKIKEAPVAKKMYQVRKAFEIDASSYIGMAINRDALESVGVTNRDYFIWWDDTEHSLRLKEYGAIYCAPEVVIEHNVGATARDEVSWKTYYGYRNTVNCYQKHFPGIRYNYYWLRLLFNVNFAKKSEYTPQLRAIINEAVSDARHHRMGVHSVYKPGWHGGKGC